MAYGTVVADQIQNTTGYTLGAGNATNFKNRLINGACVIDQRNAGASFTPASGDFIVDRWQYVASQTSKFTAQQNQGSVSLPTGFTNYIGFTSSSAYTLNSTDYFLLQQKIEGFNIADLGWGTANAKTITLSFQVYSSLTGTFGGVITNNGATPSYPFSYSIPVANTWTTISVTVVGPTTGTWLTNNGIGAYIRFSMGSGSAGLGTPGAWSATNYLGVTGQTNVVSTSGATFYVTGLQFEVGSYATGFEYRSINTELTFCQRYFESTFAQGSAPANNVQSTEGGGTSAYSSANSRTPIQWFKVTKRTIPTITFYSPNIAGQTAGNWMIYCSGWQPADTTLTGGTSQTCFMVEITRNSAPNYTSFSAYLVGGNWTASAEL